MGEETSSSEMEIDWTREIKQSLRKPKTGDTGDNDSSKPRRSKTTNETGSLQKEIDELFTDRNVKEFLRIPGDLMLAKTGNSDRWDTHSKQFDQELDTLAKTGGMAARRFVQVDPKWIVLLLFGLNLSTVYGGRFLSQLKEEREARVKESQSNGKDTNPSFPT